MKAKAILFASVLLVGCQATNQDVSQLPKVDQNLSSASDFFTATSQVDNVDWLMNDDGLTEKNIWKVVSEELKMEVPENDRIRVQKDYYLKHKSYLHDVTLRAEPYMYWIISQIKERDMPMELVLLPIVESAFNPNATSSARAAGLWQIVPTTGLYYGLKQDKWYDGRRDVAQSTTAALDMLERLNGMFNGDWLQTIAAYNCGEGRVLRAIKENEARGLPTDYWSLDLPKETSFYVPKLLALSEMIKNQDRYDISLPNSTITRALTRIEVGQQIELTQAAKMAGMPLQKLQTYNAGYKHNITAPDGPHTIMLPIDNAKRLKASLSSGELSLVNWGQHRVVNGETVEILAKRYGIAAEDIRQANGLTSQISSGQIITLPISGEYISQIAAQQTQVAQNASKQAISKTKYTVRTGDTIASVAKRHKVKASDIQLWNKMAKNSKLKVGQPLQIVTTSNRSKAITYKVRKGDSLTSIAKRHNVDINDVLDWNSALADVHNLQPGDTLTLYKR
ncbi:murein transglycosylase D [Budvicia diplopodorum]|uniref:murein transglycosylase D n=1 Tax=Budvicia diplopodorum TaxID=1119056 RepID=UPI001479389A|nr:murein transglycosylase D [Budvicia diplopodorum]